MVGLAGRNSGRRRGRGRRRRSGRRRSGRRRGVPTAGRGPGGPGTGVEDGRDGLQFAHVRHLAQPAQVVGCVQDRHEVLSHGLGVAGLQQRVPDVHGPGAHPLGHELEGAPDLMVLDGSLGTAHLDQELVDRDAVAPDEGLDLPARGCRRVLLPVRGGVGHVDDVAEAPRSGPQVLRQRLVRRIVRLEQRRAQQADRAHLRRCPVGGVVGADDLLVLAVDGQPVDRRANPELLVGVVDVGVAVRPARQALDDTEQRLSALALRRRLGDIQPREVAASTAPGRDVAELFGFTVVYTGHVVYPRGGGGGPAGGPLGGGGGPGGPAAGEGAGIGALGVEVLCRSAAETSSP
ncbi:MAG: hypothetical protein CMB99_01095 [Flavobacteriaceae bacterium]|nr:hypothetical protein [Flavobacteriaceae bacterium]